MLSIEFHFTVEKNETSLPWVVTICQKRIQKCRAKVFSCNRRTANLNTCKNHPIIAGIHMQIFTVTCTYLILESHFVEYTVCLTWSYPAKVTTFVSYFHCNGLLVKVLDSQPRGPAFKTTGWLQGRLGLSSIGGQSNEYQGCLGT